MHAPLQMQQPTTKKDVHDIVTDYVANYVTFEFSKVVDKTHDRIDETNNTKIRVLRSAIGAVTPASSGKEKDKDDSSGS